MARTPNIPIIEFPRYRLRVGNIYTFRDDINNPFPAVITEFINESTADALNLTAHYFATRLDEPHIGTTVQVSHSQLDCTKSGIVLAKPGGSPQNGYPCAIARNVVTLHGRHTNWLKKRTPFYLRTPTGMFEGTVIYVKYIPDRHPMPVTTLVMAHLSEHVHVKPTRAVISLVNSLTGKT